MAVRDWSTRRLKTIWLAGLTAEAALVALPYLLDSVQCWSCVPPHPEGDTVQPPAPAQAAEPRWVDQSVQVDSATGEKVITWTQDGVVLATMRVRADTAREVRLTPEGKEVAERAAGQVFSNLGNALRLMGIVVAVVLAAVYLPIPLTLLGITAVWWWGRRRRHQAG